MDIHLLEITFKSVTKLLVFLKIKWELDNNKSKCKNRGNEHA